MEIFTIVRIIKPPGLQPLPNRKKNIILYHWFQTSVKLILYVSIVSYVVFKWFRTYGGTVGKFPHYWDDSSFVISLFMFIWCFIFLVQAIPTLEVYVILIERMTLSLTSFLSISILFLFFFPHYNCIPIIQQTKREMFGRFSCDIQVLLQYISNHFQHARL